MESTNAELVGVQIRKAMRSYGRWTLCSIVISLATFWLFGFLWSLARPELTRVFGDSVSFGVFAVGAFASVLLPPLAIQLILSRDYRLYCPFCRCPLINPSAARCLNRTGACIYCHVDLEVPRMTTSQLLADFGVMFAAMFAFWLVCHLLDAF